MTFLIADLELSLLLTFIGLGEDKGGLNGFVNFANMSGTPEPPRGGPFHVPGRAAFSFKHADLTGDASEHLKLLNDSTPDDEQVSV